MNDELRHRLRAAGAERAARFSIRGAAISELALLGGAVAAGVRRRAAEVERLTHELEQRELAVQTAAQEAEAAVAALRDEMRRRDEEARAREQELRGTVLQIQDLLLYERLVADVAAVVESVVPERTTVAVASRGDEKLLRLGRRQAWHFPRLADGAYAGEYPARRSGGDQAGRCARCRRGPLSRLTAHRSVVD